MPEPIKQRVEVQADDAQRELRETARATDQMSDSTKRAGDEAQAVGGKNDDLGRSVEVLKGQLLALIGGVGIQQFLQEWRDAARETNEEMKQSAELTREIVKAQRDLQFLRQEFSAKDISVITRTSNNIGEDRAITAGAFAELRSKTGKFLSDDEQVALFEQLAETALTTSATSAELVPLFAKGSQFVRDPDRLQSIIRKTQDISPIASPRALANLLPGILGTGLQVGLSPEESAGLTVAALLVNEEKGATSLRNILTILGGDEAQTAGQQQVLRRAGVQRGDGILEQLRTLRDANLTAGQLAVLFGRENFEVASGMLRMNVFDENIGDIFNATTSGDPTREAIDALYGEDEKLRRVLAMEQNEQRARNERADDPRAIRVAHGRSALNVAVQAAVARREISPAMGKEILEDFDWVVSNQLQEFDEGDSIYKTELEAIEGGFRAATHRNVEMFGTMSLKEARAIRDRAKEVFRAGPELDMSGIGDDGFFSGLVDTAGRVIQNITNIVNSNIHQNDPRQIDDAARFNHSDPRHPANRQ